MTAFGARLRDVAADRGPLVVGIDPHESVLLDWGLTPDAAGARDLGLRVVEAATGRAGIVKPQVSFFERYGAAGFSALEEVLAAARGAELIVIADAKRGDIGSTMDAYAAAWLTPGAALEVDALTVSPYLGVGAVEGALAAADRAGKGVFVLAATSNPEARALQSARTADDRTVARSVLDDVDAWNAAHTADGEWGSVGVVIGATVDLAAAGIGTPATPPAPVLAPGFGHQGAVLAQTAAIFGAHASTVLPSASRSILTAGSEGIAAAIADHAAQARGGSHG